MTDDGFTPHLGNRRGLNRIDANDMLACIPDDSTAGLRRDEIRKAYGKNRAPFHDDDFDAALQTLVGDQVRTTSRTIWGRKVLMYRRAPGVTPAG